MNQRIAITRKQAEPIMSITFPSYRGRKIMVEFTETVTFHDLNWGGGTRSEYASVDTAFNSTLLRVPAPWDHPFEGMKIDLPAQIQALYEMFTDQIKKSDGKHFPERLFLTHAVLLMARAKKSRLVDWTVISAWDGHGLVHLEIPDYAYDRHNLAGRKMGRGWDHFFEVSSHLENMADVPGEEERKEQAKAMRGGKGASYMGPADDAEQEPLF